MIYPFAGTYPITAPFGYSEAYGPTYHEGIDYGMPIGTPLRAAISGTVVFAGADTHGAGRAVSIQSGITVVKCFHMDSVAVKLGQKVKAGQNIGKSGNTGNSTGPHLHFQVEKNFVPVNPQPLFKKEDDMYKGRFENKTQEKSAKGWYDRAVHYRKRTIAEKARADKLAKQVVSKPQDSQFNAFGKALVEVLARFGFKG